MWNQQNLWIPSYKDNIYPKIKEKQQQKLQIQNNRIDENHQRVKSMAHEEKNCRP
jgi:hypothetical protein